jgi:hypothetical protein
MKRVLQNISRRLAVQRARRKMAAQPQRRYERTVGRRVLEGFFNLIVKGAWNPQKRGPKLYRPNGDTEVFRRACQIERGQLTASNGLVQS